MFESRRRSKEDKEKESQEAVDRGWALLGRYELQLIDDLFDRYGVEGSEDPYEDTQIEVDLREEREQTRHREPLVEEEPFPPLAPPPPPRSAKQNEPAGRHVASEPEPEAISTLHDAQRRVLVCLHSACTSWFGFFFRTLGGTDMERREIASRGLSQSSVDLTKIAKDLAEAVDIPPERIEVTARFRSAIEVWAESFEAISRGMLLDQQRVASDGLDLMEQATQAASRSGVPASSYPGAIDTFRYLDELQPPEGASRSAAKRAKDPWRRAIKAASSAPKASRSPRSKPGNDLRG